MAKDTDPVTLSDDEVRHIQAVARAKSMEAIAVGNLKPGLELELISALDLQTVPWHLVPINLKQQLGLPFGDKGIDSMALNLTAAVQAKDYTNSTVPLKSLLTFHFMVRADKSPLKILVKQMIVATSESTKLPTDWQRLSGAMQRKYTAEEIGIWRAKANLERPQEELPQRMKNDWERWPHQLECLKSCRQFLRNKSQRDFFVQMATGSGKSLIMADLLADSGPKRACIIVPKLDLMEQLAQLLETTLTAQIARVGTGHPANLSAHVFVCVRNSAWQLSNLTFDVVMLDEAHHYEPQDDSGVHARQVLALKAPKRIFFSATLRNNRPDFDFGLRPAIQAGVIKDYSVMVPVLTAGDPRPSLVQLIQDLPLARKILAFCNTVYEAKHFTRLLSEAGIPADHYNGKTRGSRRQEVLERFQLSERLGGLRVLVTVDVLSEGVDLPVADTCLFVAPRQGIRLQQCVGRVLRNHCEKVDALVIAPAVQDSDGILAEDAELGRLLSEMAAVDTVFKKSLADCNSGCCRVTVTMGASVPASALEDAAEMLRIRVFPNALGYTSPKPWEHRLQELQQYNTEHGTTLVPTGHTTATGFNLGIWVQCQRSAKRKGRLSQERIDRLEKLGFVWDVLEQGWNGAFRELQAYKTEHGTTLVPKSHTTEAGLKLGHWVSGQRLAKRKGRLSQERIDGLEKLGFVWDVKAQGWEDSFQELEAYKAEHRTTLVPHNHTTEVGFNLGKWVDNQRSGKKAGRLNQERIDRLDQFGFVWDVLEQGWDDAFQELQAYIAEHGTILVRRNHATEAGLKLGHWVHWQRSAKRKGKLSQERIDQLERLGFAWEVRAQGKGWDYAFKELQAYIAEHGTALVPTRHTTETGFNLGIWVQYQRGVKRKGRLSQERIDRLEKLGFVWEVLEQGWNDAFRELQAYKTEHGTTLVPRSHTTEAGLKLGHWVSGQRRAKRTGRLSQERIDGLEKLGFVWDVKAQGWDDAFE